MTKKTHKYGGMFVSVVGFLLLNKRGLLLQDVNLFLQWLVIYPFTIWGSTASDLDLHWQSCPTKDYPSWLIYKLLHLTTPLVKRIESKNTVSYKVLSLFSASHRSWQTHSDLTLLIIYLAIRYVLSGKLIGLGAVDSTILSLVLIGVCLGVIAHLILDSLTPEGIWLLLFCLINKILHRKVLPEKLHLVPHREFFATGGSWENLINKVLTVLTILAVVYTAYLLIEPAIPYKITFGG